MGMKISKLKTNSTKEREGVWVEVGEGAAIKVARMPNPLYEEYLRKISKPHLRAIRAQTLSTEISVDLVVRAMAKTILLDWRGFDGDDEQPVTYSESKALEWMKEMPDFRTMVQEAAQDAAQFRDEVMVESIKNS